MFGGGLEFGARGRISRLVRPRTHPRAAAGAGVLERRPLDWCRELDNVGLLHSQPYLAIAGENSSPWTKRTARFRKSLLRYEGDQLFPGELTASPEAAALMLIGMNVAPEHEHQFNEWYNTEHIPALGAVPGVLRARRYRPTGGTQRYVALYHLHSPEVLRSAEWRKAADTPWTQKMRPHFRDMLRFECRRYAHTGGR